ncbi:MAG: Si-specific NAD(P)(+) transhydrogenase [Cryobacterium sp.]|nr:Si-specific NAD(P)(+) transhydrogenase [Oligoflexia bacterium]
MSTPRKVSKTKKTTKVPSKAAPKAASKTAVNHYDLIVIGSGPAGQRAALQAAKAGKTAAIIEKYPSVGGGCVHFGTLPSKSFRESIYRYSLGSRGVLGREADESKAPGRAKRKQSLVVPEMKRLLQRKDRVVVGESNVIRDQLKRNGIEMITGEARFTGLHEIEVLTPRRKTTLTGEKFVIAVGSRPVAPSHLAIDGKFIHDSDTVLTLKTVPKTMIVLGAGVIGCEYASMFAMAGTKVTLVDKRNRILASVDSEIVRALRDRFEYQGMEIVLGVEATKIQTHRPTAGKPMKTVVTLSDGKKIRAETVLIAQGRIGNTELLGLEAIGVQRDERGLVKVNANFRSAVDHIYAVGDVVGAPALAATAMEQGRIATCHAFGISMKTGTNAVEAEHEMPKNFPYGIYTIPEISMIGKTEEELKTENADFVVGRARYRELARGQIVGDRWGILKLLVDKKSLTILGVHIIGDNAADLIHIGQAVMAFGGDVTYFMNSVFNYPTLAEAYKTAAFNAVNVLKGQTKSVD